ncbi:hypothetical protein FS837_004915 [Tulasnella sp. UAMH 9824]|nr:hypothetical protein FS837_004915 [Tulasnella sp. UAMH 9824]
MNFLLSKTSASYLVKRSTACTSDVAIPGPVFEQPGENLEPDWTILPRASHVDHSQLELQLAKAKAFSNVLESCLETSNAQLVLAHLEITKLWTSLQETKRKAKAKNNRAKLMSSGAARLLTSEEFRGAVRKDDETAKEKLTAKEQRARKAAITRVKKQWRADDVAERKRHRTKQLSDHQKASMIDGQEEVEIDGVSGDEDEED